MTKTQEYQWLCKTLGMSPKAYVERFMALKNNPPTPLDSSDKPTTPSLKNKKCSRLPLDDKIRNSLIEKLASRFGMVCWYCGVGLSCRQTHLDHIDPLSRSGDDTIENLALACAPCNRAKWNMPMEEFFAWVRRIRWQEDFPAKDFLAQDYFDCGDDPENPMPGSL